MNLSLDKIVLGCYGNLMNNSVLLFSKSLGPWDLHVYQMSKKELTGVLWHGSYELATINGVDLDDVYAQLYSAIRPQSLTRLLEDVDV